MKEGRALYRKTGSRLYLFMVAFTVFKSYVMIPVMSKIWGLTLKTTPDGFVSNANLLRSLVRAPWIIPIGILLVFVYALVSMWQVIATVYGIAFIDNDKLFKIPDLFRLSGKELWHAVKPRNWMMLVYALIIVPLADPFQSSSVFGAFVMPEYISDFIESKMVLHLLYVILLLVVGYFALRWFYLVPSFVLKDHDFKCASDESFKLTQKKFIKNGIKISIYNLIELIRLVIIPAVLVGIASFICFGISYELPIAGDLFYQMWNSVGLDTVKNITGTFVYISVMCYLYKSYFAKLDELAMDSSVTLPELKKEKAKIMPAIVTQVTWSLIGALLFTVYYLAAIWLANYDMNTFEELFGTTKIIAHKGYSSEAPENTVPAFELADGCDNADFIELDVWNSKDGIPVVVHNESIAAATGIDKAVYEYTYEELQQIPAPYSMSEEDFPTARIPSLEEVIAQYADTTPILIEIKGYKQDNTLAKNIVDLMEKYNCTETSMIHSGDYESLKAVKELNPDIQCGLIMAVITGDCYDLPYADFFSVEHTFVTNNMISEVHKRGKKLFVWTVNYDDSAKKMRCINADALITDYPDKIAEYVTNRTLTSDIEAMFDTDMLDSESTFESGDY